jgi:hypothetical protein
VGAVDVGPRRQEGSADDQERSVYESRAFPSSAFNSRLSKSDVKQGRNREEVIERLQPVGPGRFVQVISDAEPAMAGQPLARDIARPDKVAFEKANQGHRDEAAVTQQYAYPADERAEMGHPERVFRVP